MCHMMSGSIWAVREATSENSMLDRLHDNNIFGKSSLMYFAKSIMDGDLNHLQIDIGCESI